MIPFGLSSLMTVSMPIARRATKCFVPGASAIYLFDEGTGTVLRDHSGNGHDGTLGADTTAPAWGPTGLTFDGINDYVSCGQPNRLFADPASPFSVTVAFSTTNTETVVRGLIARCGATANNRTFILYTTTNTLRARIRGTETNTGVSVSDGLPHIVTVTCDGATALLYRDAAAPVSLTIGAAAEETGEDVLLGARTTTLPRDAFLAGDLYAAVIRPFVLTAAQVAQDAAAVRGILTPRGLTPAW